MDCASGRCRRGVATVKDRQERAKDVTDVIGMDYRGGRGIIMGDGEQKG
jgi:hypothetical protein